MIGSTMGEPNYCSMHTGQASHLPHNQVDQGHKNIRNTFCTQSGHGEAEMRAGMCRACEKKAQHLLLSRQPHLDGTAICHGHLEQLYTNRPAKRVVDINSGTRAIQFTNVSPEPTCIRGVQASPDGLFKMCHACSVHLAVSK